MNLLSVSDPQKAATGKELKRRTWFREAQDFRDVGHEDPAFELEFGVLVPNLGTSRPRLVLLVLALVGREFFTAEKDTFKKVNLIVPFRIGFTRDDRVHAVEEKLSKVLHTMVFPVVDTIDKFVQRFVQKISVDCLVCSFQDTLSGGDTGSQILFDSFVLTLLHEILRGVMC